MVPQVLTVSTNQAEGKVATDFSRAVEAARLWGGGGGAGALCHLAYCHTTSITRLLLIT